jgi:hypothetical protein
MLFLELGVSKRDVIVDCDGRADVWTSFVVKYVDMRR